MWTVFRMIAVVLALLGAAAPCLAAGGAGKAAVIEPLHRGIGIPGWFTWTRKEMSNGKFVRYAPDPFLARSVLWAEDMQYLKSSGIDFVRLGVDPGPFIEANPATRRAYFARIGATIRQFNAAGLAVVWDYHPEGKGAYYSYEDLFVSGGRFAPAFDQLVSETASYLKAFSEKSVYFEIINEPPMGCHRDMRSAEEPIMRIYNAARRANDRLYIVVEGDCYASIDGLIKLKPANFAGADRVIWSFHFYEPAQFSQQGEKGHDATLSNIGLMPYGDATRPKSVILQTFHKNIEGAPITILERTVREAAFAHSLDNYYAKIPNRAGVQSRISQVNDWARENHIPAGNILLGEFGVCKFVDGRGADPTDRARWIRDVREVTESFGFSWAFWEYFDPSGHMSIMESPTSRVMDRNVAAALGLSPGK